MKRTMGSETLTSGVRVTTLPTFLPAESDPQSKRFVFSYRIRITNESDLSIKLIRRHWIIVDSDGRRHEVEGEGVIGQQPELAPGEAFEYASYSPLATPWGTMEGTFWCVHPTGGKRSEQFPVRIDRFYLVSSKAPAIARA